MTKQELVTAVRNSLGEKFTNAEVTDILNAVVSVCAAELQNGGEVTLTGLVSFKQRTRKARAERKARNPSTGAEVLVPAKPEREVVVAKVAKALRK